MYFSRLEMIGFKSFASKTLIEFRPGVMAVVGPNGCGKTNIVDAIRWVLGEQRTSALRAERMESVIFNGTQVRRPLGMAEVTLALENDKGMMPTPFSEVGITRRLFRSGDSEYLINRTPSRLRDIQDLFANTGLGRGTYSIIELSMVEGIISGPSAARRELIEEAAGIAKFKIRRNSAERRLATTKENLVRIDDLYSEVEKRYRTLKRQAARAIKFKTLDDALTQRTMIDLAKLMWSLDEQCQPLVKKVNSLNVSIEENEKSLAVSEANISKLEAEELTTIDQLNRLQNNLKQIERRENQTTNELALTRQRITFLESDLQDASRQREAKSLAINEAKHALNDAEAEIIKKRSAQETATTTLSALEKDFQGLREQYEIARRELDGFRQREGRAQSRKHSYFAEQRRREAEDKRNRERIDRLTQSKSRYLQQTTDIKSKIKAEEERLIAEQDQLKQVLAEIRNLQSEQSKLKAELSDHSDRVSQAREAFEKARIDLLTHDARSGASDDFSLKFKKKFPQHECFTIADRLQCDSRYRAALAAALKDVLDALDVPADVDLATLFRLIDAQKRGTVRLQRETGKFPVELVEAPEGETDVWEAWKLIENDGDFGEFLRRRLHRVLIVKGRDEAVKLAEWASEQQVKLVTLDGESIDSEGIAQIGMLNPDAMQIGWQVKHDELSVALEKVRLEYEQVKNDAAGYSQKIKELDSSLSQKNNAKRSLEDRNAGCQRRITGLKDDLKRNDRQLKEIEDEISQSKLFLENATESTLGTDLEQIENDIATAINARKEAEQRFAVAEENRVQHADRRADLTAARARANEQCNEAERLIQRRKQELNNVLSELAKFEATASQHESDLEQTRQAAMNHEKLVELTRREKGAVEQDIEKRRLERKQIRVDLEKYQQFRKSTQSNLQQQIKERSGVEIDVIKLQERTGEAERRIVSELEIQPQSLTKSTVITAQDRLETAGLADVSTDELKKRLASLGPVNMMALEELDEVEERYNFLTDQKQDLENGIEVLEETIDRINNESRRRFRETFEQVNSNFQGLFRRLFEGGEARIQMLDGDPLAADIKIWATPSGKKMQSLQVLSGGEKALTAIALLFAIYDVRPSPFCILDEVDAPLDDANVIRFNRLLKEYSAKTQYLIVTHNKRTMAAADSLIGVTLNQDGGSHLVSVKLGNEESSDET